ncbi:hypothetical protein QR77_25900 [Streptomyces sp. 150FB]|uniref:hypothetical protein n=1 Tax=Streptomyces sp. 150FB TaxID=1576605 RepID=UPI0005891AA3|nr:hypothetical protein [Streptomyces sp. 150FB]KIF76383.1 hypothetical protein QR77_25900 [Streptomyces sp. 150FB]
MRIRRSAVITWAALMVTGYGATVFLGEPKALDSPRRAGPAAPTASASPSPSLSLPDCPQPTEAGSPMVLCAYSVSR